MPLWLIVVLGVLLLAVIMSMFFRQHMRDMRSESAETIQLRDLTARLSEITESLSESSHRLANTRTPDFHRNEHNDSGR